MLTITSMQAMNDLTHIYTQGRFNNHAANSFYRIILTTASVMGVIKMGNIAARVGMEPTSLAFCFLHSRPVC